MEKSLYPCTWFRRRDCGVNETPLARFGLEIELLPKSGHELFESLMHFQKEDVVFIFGFVAMNREATVLLDYAKKVNYKTIIVTDC